MSGNGDSLSIAEAACLLRAARRQKEALASEQQRLVDQGTYVTFEERQRLIEVCAELQCVEAAIRWLWRQR